MNSSIIHDSICKLIHKKCHLKSYYSDIKYHTTLKIIFSVPNITYAEVVIVVWKYIVWGHPNLLNVILHNVTPLLYLKTLGNGYVNLNLPLCCHISLPCITWSDIKVLHQRIQTIHLHASCCHRCSVDFDMFHNVTWSTNSLLSCTRVNNKHLMNITCTLVATSKIQERLECIVMCTRALNRKILPS